MARAGTSPSSGSSTWSTAAAPVSGTAAATVTTTASRLRTTARLTAWSRKASRPAPFPACPAPVRATILPGTTTRQLGPVGLSVTADAWATATVSTPGRNASSNASLTSCSVRLWWRSFEAIDNLDSPIGGLFFADKCEKPQDAGGCRGNFTRWSYDKASMTCKEFTWGGCQGNENNFLSEKECDLRCKDSSRSRGKTLIFLLLLVRVPQRVLEKRCPALKTKHTTTTTTKQTLPFPYPHTKCRLKRDAT